MTTNVIRFLVHKPQRKIAFSRTTIRIYSDNDLLNAAPTKQIASSASSNIGNFPPLFYRLPSLCCIHWDWRLAVAVWCSHLHIALTATTSIYFFFTSFLHLVTCSLTRLTCCISLPTYLWVRERREIFEEHVTFTNQLNNIFFFAPFDGHRRKCIEFHSLHLALGKRIRKYVWFVRLAVAKQKHYK